MDEMLIARSKVPSQSEQANIHHSSRVLASSRLISLLRVFPPTIIDSSSLVSQILVTPLSQRYFTDKKVRETLSAQSQATIAAAKSGDFAWIDLHAESMKYLNSIGEAEANTLSPLEKDKPHLSPKGTKVFGKMGTDLIAVKVPGLKEVFVR
ncbi:F-actin-capping protein subunit beta [Venturia nashicola]|uniref:F-actin-capping protein subunit beta n=1 Tax=Venturia nashicola TaxID=86259 RepID=A0A4Z1P7Q9_9PEZI|nr:F-actin-capping protein subunit beta [Venturia nashicola]